MSPASLKPTTIFPLPQDSVYILEQSLWGHSNPSPTFLSSPLHPAFNEAYPALSGLQPVIEMAFSFWKILPSPHCLADCASHLIITRQSNSLSDAVTGTPLHIRGPQKPWMSYNGLPRTTTPQMFPGFSAGSGYTSLSLPQWVTAAVTSICQNNTCTFHVYKQGVRYNITFQFSWMAQKLK